jgi:hypothetical protein
MSDLAAVLAVLNNYFDFELDSWEYDATPEPEDVWRLHRDLRAVLFGEAAS